MRITSGSWSGSQFISALRWRLSIFALFFVLGSAAYILSSLTGWAMQPQVTELVAPFMFAIAVAGLFSVPLLTYLSTYLAYLSMRRTIKWSGKNLTTLQRDYEVVKLGLPYIADNLERLEYAMLRFRGPHDNAEFQMLLLSVRDLRSRVESSMAQDRFPATSIKDRAG